MGLKARRRWPTRAPLDWRWSFRTYVFVPSVLLWGLVIGLGIARNGTAGGRALGATMVVASVLAMAAIAVWLLRPVDLVKQEQLRRSIEERRIIEWKGFWDPLRAWRAGRRPD